MGQSIHASLGRRILRTLERLGRGSVVPRFQYRKTIMNKDAVYVFLCVSLIKVVGGADKGGILVRRGQARMHPIFKTLG